MLVLMVAYAAVLGAALASFGCVVSERVPAGEPITGRSHCVCGRQLRAAENVPVLGWLRARRGASCCGSRPPVRYVVAEGAAAVWGAGVGGVASRVLEAGHVVAGGVFALAGLTVGTLVVVAATWQRPPAR